jgi:G3E family GTPase
MLRVPVEPRGGAGGPTTGTVLPLTVIAGYLGAGKTTLLGHLLRNTAARRIAVVVNDFERVSVDERLVRQRAGNVLSFANGCICCRAGGAFAEALTALRDQGDQVEHVLVETSGMAAPQNIAQYGHLPGYRLDGIIIVTDAEAVRSQAMDPGVGPDVLGQLVAGDLVVLNKADLVSRPELDSVCDWLRELVPETRIVESSYGRLPPSLLLGRHPSDESRLERRSRAPGRTVERHPHEVGYTSWSWIADEPLNEAGFRWWAATLPEGVLRAKGILHLRTDPSVRYVFDLIGSRWTLRREGPWRWEPPRTTIALVGRAQSFVPGWLEMTLRRSAAAPEGRVQHDHH